MKKKTEQIMSLILAKNISEFKNFSDIDSKLMIYERNAPKGSVSFFKNLIKNIESIENFYFRVFDL